MPVLLGTKGAPSRDVAQEDIMRWEPNSCQRCHREEVDPETKEKVTKRGCVIASNVSHEGECINCGAEYLMVTYPDRTVSFVLIERVALPS